MAARRRFSISFANTAGPIDAGEFAEFFNRFTCIYDAVGSAEHLPALRNIGVTSSPSDIERAVDQDGAEVVSLFADSDATIASLRYLFFQDSDKLLIREIVKESPLHIVVSAVPAALAAAAIFSGGEVEMVGFKVKLPPLGVGIASLRKAMEPKSTKRPETARKVAARPAANKARTPRRKQRATRDEAPEAPRIATPTPESEAE